MPNSISREGLSIKILWVCVSILALRSRHANRIFWTQHYYCNVWFVHIIS